MSTGLCRVFQFATRKMISLLYYQLMIEIFSHLDLITLSRMRLVCRKWKQLAEDPRAWSRIMTSLKLRQPNRNSFVDYSIKEWELAREYFLSNQSFKKSAKSAGISRLNRKNPTLINSLQFDRDLLVTAGSNSEIELLDLHNTANKVYLLDPGRSVEALHFKDNLLVTGNDIGIVKFWDIDQQVLNNAAFYILFQFT